MDLIENLCFWWETEHPLLVVLDRVVVIALEWNDNASLKFRDDDNTQSVHMLLTAAAIWRTKLKQSEIDSELFCACN